MQKTYKPSRYIVETNSLDEEYTLLFNTRTGALIQLPNISRPELFRCLENPYNDENIKQTRLFHMLLHGGFIINTSVNELDEIQKLYYQRIERPVLNISIMPTLECNMACPYCFEVHRSVNIGSQEANSILSFIKRRLSNVKELFVDWYGGEPLLKVEEIVSLQNRIKSMCRECNKKAIFSMTTNGFLLTPKICDNLVNAGIRSFQVTIDGPKSIHDSRRFLKGGKPTFDRIVANVCYAVQKVPVNIRVNVDRTNINHIEEMIETLSSLGLNKTATLSFKAVVPPGGHDGLTQTFSMQEFGGLVHGIAKIAVKNGFNVYTEQRNVCEFCIVDLPEQWIIGPDLYVYKCADTFDPDNESIGRISSDGRLDLIDTINLWRSKPIFNDSKCRECIYLPQCMGGCSLKKLIHKKDWCPEERFAIEGYVQRLYEGLQRN